jgi:hypothetical protein
MVGGMFAGNGIKGKTLLESFSPPPGAVAHGMDHHRLLFFQDSEIDDVRFDRQ